MRVSWKNAFSKVPDIPFFSQPAYAPADVTTLMGLKRFLDYIHIRACLLRPYAEQPDYPLVESRELLPSFDCDSIEHTHLPGFSLLALDRPLNYFSEPFQFDILHDLFEQATSGRHPACPLEGTILSKNRQTLLDRLPSTLHDSCKKTFAQGDITLLEMYPALLPYLLEMDRAHVFSLNTARQFFLSGIYASFPSDLDAAIKEIGLQMRKFTRNDNASYERNRNFVYQYFMELYGFPVASERRTSSVVFARKLLRMKENFFIRVLSESDRTLTTLYSHPAEPRYPLVEKIALVQVDKEQQSALDTLEQGDYFVDKKNRVVILRVRYTQHRYNPDNVRQDRALSIHSQEVIHPLTGHSETRLNIIKDTSNMFLRLTDIIRGEYRGTIVYRRTETVKNTRTHEHRLKFLFTWLSKHQRRIIGYSEEFYINVTKVLDMYLFNQEHKKRFDVLADLYQEVLVKYSYIQQARKVQHLEYLHTRVYLNKQIGYLEMLSRSNDVLQDLKFEAATWFAPLIEQAILLGDNMLGDTYLLTTYINKEEQTLTPYGQNIRKQYGRMVTLLDELRAIRKSRLESHAEQ